MTITLERSSKLPIELHPWNASFEWRDHHGPFRRVTEQQARDYDELGYFVLEDAFDADTVAELDALVAPHDAARQTNRRPLTRKALDSVRRWRARRGQRTIGASVALAIHLVARLPEIRQFSRLPLFADLCHDLVGPDVRVYWDQAISKRPRGTEPVLWHQDNGYTYVEPQAYLTCWIALSDATLDNGCIWVVPGVHRRGTIVHRWKDPIGFQCFEDPPGAVPVPVRAGSIVVFPSLTPHATGVNVTDDLRRSYILQYAADGTVARRGSPAEGPGVLEPEADPVRQFLVLEDGQPVGL